MTRSLLALAAALALGGCISFGEDPPPSLLTLSATSSVAPGKILTAKPDAAIAVLVPRVPAALATTRVPVQSGATQVAYLKEAVWVEAPARLFERLLEETIGARTGRVVIGPRDYAGAPGMRLSGELQNFGLDATRMEAVVTYDAVLQRDGSDEVMTRRFEARVPAGEAKPEPVGRAINEAANKVADEVTAWLAEATS
ncbi:ABC-type transport auxiliary lipoprotein family protein [Sphingomonas sanxanigenens]|uniref:ABC-type transport auxiliary lipoprotein component domain-containing protein n=1 Tax=Sphingomonas sanxanigenens DSM 19645 = NX02 TaxID=1123269 RepID=W0AJQ0_9SPHN|nr:ABC-type transport auxiliary lipoprotein family protein [Sphingomonas sanxanigenens]AHE56493.1 hypothetical protein NX02_24430 [Sphingomonas sanxanigenens DSM 19645 = NX02]